MPTVPGIRNLTFEALNVNNKHFDYIYCTADNTKMLAYPHIPTLQLEGYQCSLNSCRRQITTDQIIEAFQKVQIFIENSIPVSILFNEGRLLIESTEFIGTERRNMRRKALTTDFIDELKQIIKEEIEKILSIRMTNLSCIFQS